MHWGAGPELGLLAFLGYVVFLTGAALIWRKRGALSIWAHDEFGLFRRNLSRYTEVGPFYGLREESCFRSISSQFVGSLSRFPACHTHVASALLLLGAVLFLLDFFI